MQAEDNGNEEEYRHIIGPLMERAFAAAFLFYLNEWLKPGNAKDPDCQNALQALKCFSVKTETTNQDGSIRNDVGVIIPFSSMFRKTIPTIAKLVCMSNMNAKNTGQAQYPYGSIDSPTLPNIKTVDEAMTVGLDLAEAMEEDVTIKSLKTHFVEQYRLPERHLEWPLFAMSHFAQVSLSVYCCTVLTW